MASQIHLPVWQNANNRPTNWPRLRCRLALPKSAARANYALVQACFRENLIWGIRLPVLNRIFGLSQGMIFTRVAFLRHRPWRARAQFFEDALRSGQQKRVSCRRQRFFPFLSWDVLAQWPVCPSVKNANHEKDLDTVGT